MTTADAPTVAALSGQLGYPISPETIAERLGRLSLSPDHGFYVAEDDGGAVLGWVHIYGVHLLESPVLFAEIGGLVVDESARRQGIGRALMTAAEAWAKAHNFAEVRLRSGTHRTDAHEFYAGIGYEFAKTSKLFRKKV